MPYAFIIMKMRYKCKQNFKQGGVCRQGLEDVLNYFNENFLKCGGRNVW